MIFQLWYLLNTNTFTIASWPSGILRQKSDKYTQFEMDV